MNRLVVGLLGAATIAVTLVLLRGQRVEVVRGPSAQAPGGERHPAHISLDRIRELGL